MIFGLIMLLQKEPDCPGSRVAGVADSCSMRVQSLQMSRAFHRLISRPEDKGPVIFQHRITEQDLRFVLVELPNILLQYHASISVKRQKEHDRRWINPCSNTQRGWYGNQALPPKDHHPRTYPWLVYQWEAWSCKPHAEQRAAADAMPSHVVQEQQPLVPCTYSRMVA